VISHSDTALNTPLHEFQSFFTFSDTFFCHQRIVENFSDPIFSQPKPLSLRTTLIFFSPATAFLELKEFLLFTGPPNRIDWIVGNEFFY